MYRSATGFLFILITFSAFSQEYNTGGSAIPVFKVYNLTNVNSGKLDFCPVIFENNLVFVSEHEIDYVNLGENRFEKASYLSLQYSTIETVNDSFVYSRPKLFSNRINQLNHNGPISFSKDGKTAVFTRTEYYKNNEEKIFRPRLYSTINENGKWKEIILLNINRKGVSFGHPSLSANGEYLYFSSDMEGGYGGKDIYVSRRDGELWGEPVNIGPEINTEGNEMFPFIYKDSLLYYSSDAHGGSGGMDLFFAGKIDGDWIFVSNLGATINSEFDDFGIFLNDDGNSGYFSSNRSGGAGKDDIYGFTVEWVEPYLTGNTLAGRFQYKTLTQEKPIGIKIYLLNDQGDILHTALTDEKGYFVFNNLPFEQSFIIKIDEQIPELALLLLDDNNNIIAELSSSNEGMFLYRKLTYQEFGKLSFLYTPDTGTLNDAAPPTKSLTGQFNYRILSTEHPKRLEIILINDEGEILYTALTNEEGKFVFKNLPFDQNYIIKTEKYNPDIELFIFNNEKLVANLVSNEEGRFEYIKLFHEAIYELAMIDDNDPNFSRGLEPVMLDIKKDAVLVLGNDNVNLFAFRRLQHNDPGMLPVIREPDPGLCPGTFDLKLEEMDDCIDIAIEDLLSETDTIKEYFVESKFILNKTDKSSNIYFYFDDFYLTKEAKSILDTIAVVLNTRSELKLEIKAYTDIHGDVDYNLRLSQRRFNHTLDYFISKGIGRERLTGQGYGETNFAVSCINRCTKEQHRLNRRALLRMYQGK